MSQKIENKYSKKRSLSEKKKGGANAFVPKIRRIIEIKNPKFIFLDI